MLKLLHTLISEAGQVDMQDMRAAYAEKDWATVERLAHKIKGGATYLGTHRLKFACQYLERYHKAGHSAQLDALYHQVLAVNEETVEGVRAWLRVYSTK